VSDDLDDLLTAPAPVVKKRPSVIRSERLAAQQALLDGGGVTGVADEHEALAEVLAAGGTPDLSMLMRPLTPTNLATLLGKEPRRVIPRLMSCPVAGQAKHKGKTVYTYYLKDAINYLATPPVDAFLTWFRSQSTATMPPILTEALWKAEKTKTQVMEAAGELWHTEDVQRVFAQTTPATI